MRRQFPKRTALGAFAAAAISTTASAQFGNEWVEFTKDSSMLSSGTISNSTNETDMDWGDLDKDGWIDVVVVRKQPFTSAGRRTNILLMNENGVLTNRTSLYATDADVGGDQGFNTPTNDRDVIIADFNVDGWDDFVTATTISDNQPKHIGHPRIYRNKAETGGNWNGVKFENNRIPQLFQYDNNQPRNPRFCSVAAGDLTGNGAPDLFFGDYDSSGDGGAGQPGGFDLNDRLLANDGNGFFADESNMRCTTSMLRSAFGMATEIHDMNNDGVLDVIKDSALNTPQNVRVLYNNPNNEGFFNIEHVIHTFQPYHIDVGELNNDGLLDIIVSDDGADRFRFATGIDSFGRVTWSSAKTFTFMSGSDNQFGSNNLIVDLDEDGWNDVIIADVDVDIDSSTGRLHIYRNTGVDGQEGSTNIQLKEERQSATGSFGSGWIGVKGMFSNDMRDTHDVAVFDIDKDGDKDMVVSREAGTVVWRNLLDPAPPIVCQTDLGFGGPGNANLTICGTGLASGQTSQILLDSAAPSQAALLCVGVLNIPTPILGGTLVPVDLALLAPFFTSPLGEADLGVINGGHGKSPLLNFQAVIIDPSQTEGADFSNAVAAQYLP